MHQIVREEQSKDTWSGMLWKDFISTAVNQGFKVTYQKVVSDKAREEEIEAIMYRKDGLILYATSFNETLNKAVIEGEMGRGSFDLAKQAKLRINVYTFNDGEYTFSREVQDGFIQFLEELKEIPIHRQWKEHHRALNILSSKEEVSMMQDCEDVKFAKQRAIQIQKLSKCCKEAKNIVAAVLEIPKERDIDHFMLWKSFLETIAEYDFQIGYRNKFVDVDGSEQMEAILYRTDGLLLFACSECGCLAKANLYGEVKLHSKKEIKRFSEYCEAENCGNGIFVFTMNACLGLKRRLQFLKGFELNQEWSVNAHSLNILNRAERVFLEGSSDERVQAARIVRTKLLRCYTGAKKVMNVMIEHAPCVSTESFTPRRNPFYLLRKYSVN